MLKTKLRLAALAALCAAFLLPLAATADNTTREKLKVAGTFLTSRIDANGDGDASSWCTLTIKGGRQGLGMQQCVNEDVFQGPTNECPGGLYIVDAANGVGSGAGVRTFKKAEDQIFFALTERYLCADEFGAIEGTDRGVVTGGQGRYVGATGFFTAIYTGQILYFDLNAQPSQFFGSIIGESEWEVQLAR